MRRRVGRYESILYLQYDYFPGMGNDQSVEYRVGETASRLSISFHTLSGSFQELFRDLEDE